MDTAAPRRVLEIRDLRTSFASDRGEVRSVDGVSLHLDAGETLGVVGESGCGKSVTALSVMRLIPTPPGRYAGGEILFEGTDLLRLSGAAMRRLRGNALSMIFQEPMTSLNPSATVGAQIAEAFVLHRGLGRAAAREEAVRMLRLVGIPEPARRVDEFPHQLSGGMRQRVMIAIALSCQPRLLIADEPTTALDVTIQAQILELIGRLQAELGTAVLLITHDLGIVAETCDRVVVMYAGRVVEESDVLSLFDQPLHPYTEGLLASIPRLDQERDRLLAIEGSVPSPLERPPGCAFAPRCRYAFGRCREEVPALVAVVPGRGAACFLAGERAAAGLAA